MKVICIIILSAFIFGCPVRTVYVPQGDAVKLRETVKGVKVWVKTKSDDIVAGKMDLYEGWFCLPLDEADLQSLDDPQAK
jgi:hypothetical protein